MSDVMEKNRVKRDVIGNCCMNSTSSSILLGWDYACAYKKHE